MSSLNAEAPALLVRSAVRAAGADRTAGKVSNVVQQAKCARAGRLNQSVGEGIVHAQIGRCSIVLIGSDHLGPLVVSLRTIAQKTVRARTVLPEVDAVAAADYGLRRDLIGKAKTRLNIFPVRNPVRAMARIVEDLPTDQCASHILLVTGSA